jgi:hypothetical protein
VWAALGVRPRELRRSLPARLPGTRFAWPVAIVRASTIQEPSTSAILA